MGNQREIIQVEPFHCWGVAACVRDENVQAVQDYLKQLNYHHYTYFIAEGNEIVISNLDVENSNLGALAGSHIAIQSGGKMWGGYENFVDHVRQLACHLEDVLFYVGDEVAYIDEFRIKSGQLFYQRVHEGGWRDLEHFLAENGIEFSPLG